MKEDKKEAVLGVIAGALGLKREKLSEEDSMQTVEQWDSFGHILILTALDKKFNGKVASIQNLARATSVRKILDIFKKERLL